ncbi:Hsp20 family protein [Amycolatopsis sp., V23-08]|uniref:Hsp20 family protein n=1 Tax=Amycolatopsis heterodermiae TaxID=3110235 RepID=A0ABU5RG71_9PSEU|nr:Hsp20 family protein [Amycolatopsis sp., V23-08]MEA5365277.1 Hsp20 family protein [Amycolatopsis sp., V23-08]
MTLMRFDPFRDLRREGDELLVDERPQGEFSRQFFLGDNLDSTRLSAEFDRGVLVLGIPVAEAGKPRKVEIGGRTTPAGEKPRIAGEAAREEPANV